MAGLEDVDITEVSNEGVKMEIRHPATDEILRDHEGKPMWILAQGRYSKTFQQTARDAMDRRLNKRGSRATKTTSAQLDAENTEAIARCVKDWHVVVGGQVVPYSFENVYEILADEKFAWLRDQLDEFISDDGNFTTS